MAEGETGLDLTYTWEGDAYLRRGTDLGSWTNGRLGELFKDVMESGRRWERPLEERKFSSSDSAGRVDEVVYEDMAEEARGGNSRLRFHMDAGGFVGRGLDPLGRAGRFVRSSDR